MTDQLETDLRAMLATRAAEVSPDRAAGEAAIATRLRFGDTTLAEIVPLTPTRRTRWRMGAAAAVAAGAILGVAVWATRDTHREAVVTDPAHEAPPAIFTDAGSPEEVAGTYLFDRLEIAQGQELTVTRVPTEPEDPADLTGVAWQLMNGDALAGGTVVLRDLGEEWEVVESYSDGASIDEITRSATTITVHSTGPAGSHLSLSVHRLDGEAITAGGCGGTAVGSTAASTVDAEPVGCDLIDEPVEVGDEPVTVRLSIVTPDGVPLTLEEHLVPAAEDAGGA